MNNDMNLNNSQDTSQNNFQQYNNQVNPVQYQQPINQMPNESVPQQPINQIQNNNVSPQQKNGNKKNKIIIIVVIVVAALLFLARISRVVMNSSSTNTQNGQNTNSTDSYSLYKTVSAKELVDSKAKNYTDEYKNKKVKVTDLVVKKDRDGSLSLSAPGMRYFTVICNNVSSLNLVEGQSVSITGVVENNAFTYDGVWHMKNCSVN